MQKVIRTTVRTSVPLNESDTSYGDQSPRYKLIQSGVPFTIQNDSFASQRHGAQSIKNEQACHLIRGNVDTVKIVQGSCWEQWVFLPDHNTADRTSAWKCRLAIPIQRNVTLLLPFAYIKSTQQKWKISDVVQGCRLEGEKIKSQDKYKEASKMTKSVETRPQTQEEKQTWLDGEMCKQLCPNQILRANSWETEKAVQRGKRLSKSLGVKIHRAQNKKKTTISVFIKSHSWTCKPNLEVKSFHFSDTATC